MEQNDLNHIRNFVKLVQSGSFTKAAEILRQPKSRVSRHLASLEKSLGVQLVYRTTRQFQLTEMGRLYFERAQGLVEGLESLSSEVSETTAEVSGVLKLTASDDMGVRLLPPILEDFSKLYPQIRFELHLSQAYVDLVKESVDIAVRIGHLKDSSLRAKKIGLVRSIFVASPSFLERHKQAEDFSQLAKLPFLALNSMGKFEVFKVGENTKALLKPDCVFTANNPAVLVEMAILGRGYSFVPEFLCLPAIRSGKLVHIQKQYRGIEVPISLVTPEQKEMPLRIKTFLEFLGKRLKEQLVSDSHFRI